MEHLNRVIKEGVGTLGLNKCESTIIHLGKAIRSLESVVKQFDDNSSV